tara:strand:+ start:31 stop:903 length:873 start_codon:yes stop_codon:yes gene_type:complete
MLSKLNNIFIITITLSFILFGCSSNKQNTSSQESQKVGSSGLDSERANVSAQAQADEFSEQQTNYEIKKLNSEINYLKEQIMALDVKSSLYADPFDIYNKEIILNNGSSIFCKILSQNNNQIFVETLIGNLTIDRTNVVRIVENITVLEDGQLSNEVIEISDQEEQQIMEDSDLLNKRKQQSSASIVLLGDIQESRDKSGNTILRGELQNIGTQRADLVRIDFTLRKNFQGDIETLTAYAVGSSHIFKDTGIISNSSIKPGAIGEFKIIIPNSMGNFIGYTYELDWDFYE